MKEIEQNIIKSFELAKEDIYRIYSLVESLQTEVIDLRKTNSFLAQKVSSFHSVKSTKIISKRAKTKFVASKVGTKVHTTKCAFAKNIKPKNKLSFAGKNTALNKGFKRCACVA